MNEYESEKWYRLLIISSGLCKLRDVYPQFAKKLQGTRMFRLIIAS